MKYEIHACANTDAPHVLLSAGLGGTSGFWLPQIEPLRQFFNVMTYDQRGTGRNACTLPESYSISAMADDVLEILDDAGVAQCHFIGHALGGLVGLELATRAPSRINRMVLVNAWAQVDSHTRRCFSARTELLRKSGVEAYVRAQPIFLYPAAWLSANVARIEQDDAHGVAHFQGTDNLLKRLDALLAFDVRDRLAAINTPTLVAASRDDVLVPWTASDLLAKSLPNATFSLEAEGGHGYSVVAPEKFNADMIAYLLPDAETAVRA